MIHLTLKQMRYFEALAHHRHFGRAAEASAVTQPALSMQIREMETELGQALFERGGRQVTLTGFGIRVAKQVRHVLQSVDDLSDLARSARGAFLDRLRLGVIPTVAPYLLPDIVKVMNKTFPGLDLNIRETLTSNLLDELGQGALDAAIVALPVSEAHLIEKSLFTESFVLIRPAADAGEPVPNPENLAKMRLLLLEEGHCFRDQALAFCSSQSGLPNDGLDASTLSTLVQMVGAGVGVTLIPEIAAPIEVGSAAVSQSHFPEPQPERIVGMVWRRSSALSAQLEQIANALEAALSGLPNRSTLD